MILQMNKAVFIDKDGTLIRDIPYNIKPGLIELAADAAPALRLLQEQGYLLIVISNQSGVARGYFTEEALTPVSDFIGETLAKEGITISGFYYCPHYAGGTVEEYSFQCDCRKPKPGLILQATDDFSIDVSLSWMIGDNVSDVEAGGAAGCRTILLKSNDSVLPELTESQRPDYTAHNLLEAANIIQETSGRLND